MRRPEPSGLEGTDATDASARKRNERRSDRQGLLEGETSSSAGEQAARDEPRDVDVHCARHPQLFFRRAGRGLPHMRRATGADKFRSATDAGRRQGACCREVGCERGNERMPRARARSLACSQAPERAHAKQGREETSGTPGGAAARSAYARMTRASLGGERVAIVGG